VFDDIKVDSFGFEIDRLRHIITPSLDYSYIHDPTLPSDRLTGFDGIDSISQGNSMTFSLENKLQTKRDGGTVDFIRLLISSPYYFKLEGHGGRFGDITFDLDVKPNSWLEYYTNAEFDLRRHKFRTADFDVKIPFENNKGKIGAGYRYSTDDSSKLLTFTLERQLNPKWRLKTYHRVELTSKKESFIEEQEITFSRDLHCWEVEFTVNSRKKKGVEFWLGFRCKAFPDLGFDFSKGHQQPKNP